MSRPRLITSVLAAALSVGLAGAALAQTGTPQSGGPQAGTPSKAPAGGRYTMHPADGGMLRLDSDTGNMSFCKGGKDGQWACESMPDERSALNKEIDRLGRENRDLQAAIRRLEDLNGIPNSNKRAEAPSSDRTGPGGIPLPNAEDVDKAMTYLQSMLKKFKEKLKEFEDLDGKPTQKL